MYLLGYHLEPKSSCNTVCIILINTGINVQLNIQISQSSAATNVRGGGKFYSCFLRGLSQNRTVKELLKSFHSCPSYRKSKTCTFSYGSQQGRGDGPEAGTSGASEAARASCRLGSPGALPPPREIFKKFRNFKCHIVRFSA